MIKFTHRLFLSIIAIFNSAITAYMFYSFNRAASHIGMTDTDLLNEIGGNLKGMIVIFNVHLFVFVAILWGLYGIIIYYARNNTNVLQK